MTYQNIAACPIPLSEEIFRRLMMALFVFLCWQCADIILHPITDGFLYLIILCLFAVPEMVVTVLLFGNRNITRDINELNFYGLIIHLIALPLYRYGIPSVYHNMAIYGIICLIVARLLWIDPRTADGDFRGLPVFGYLGCARRWLESRQRMKTDELYPYWAAVLFFGSVVPIWLIMLRTNDQMVTFATAALMVFIFFIARVFQAQFDARHPAALTPSLAHPITKEARPTNPRDIARQLLNAYHAIHPEVQVNNVAFSKHRAHAFPDDNILHPDSMAARRHEWLKQIVELSRLAEIKLIRKHSQSIEKDDFARLSLAFRGCFSLNPANGELKYYIKHVIGSDRAFFNDTTMMLACDLLISAWLRILLHCDDIQLVSYAELDALSRSFVKKFSPHDFDAPKADDPPPSGGI